MKHGRTVKVTPSMLLRALFVYLIKVGWYQVVGWVGWSKGQKGKMSVSVSREIQYRDK